MSLPWFTLVERRFTLSLPYLELRPSPPRALVLSVEELILRLLGSMADLLLWAGMPTALRPVALDIVLDLVIPRA